ncbi:YBR285W [Zygosaccharomyces parabailii]|nr:YBR285W [Zygosaccharomyces parabailii]CDH16025.1 uncharacterized protein ZBAI_07813 [Zygosaccharomyces bailii ISA1307]SJM83043.1 uncharacterized protein ZBIST_0805 [Zygosaccharomyces bailii]
MSFLQKLMSYKPYRKQADKKQQVPQETQVPVYMRDEGDFVNVFPVVSGGDEESADVSKWEMAEVLSHRNKTVVSKKSSAVSDGRLAKIRCYQHKSLSKATTIEDTRTCMEDSKELEKYDDKRSRILKGSHRRKYVDFDLDQ